MKKGLKLLLVVCVSLVILLITARVTHMLDVMQISTPAVSPVYEVGSYVLVSSLKKPGYDDYIVFRSDALIHKMGDSTAPPVRMFYKVVGMGGDTIQLINGLLHRNGRMADDTLTLKFRYLIDVSDAERLGLTLDNPETDSYVVYSMKNVVICSLSPAQLQKGQPFTRLERLIDTTRTWPSDVELFGNNETRKWNLDQYGPLVVPQGHYFVLGNNRHNAADSRFMGFVAAKDVIAATIGRR